MSITLTKLTKRFGTTLVINNLSLEINDGELFVLLGGSGSGKSTILRLIAGLIQPDQGRLEINGRDVTALPPQERGVGFVFQNYSVFRHMTATENIAFPLTIRGLPAAQRRQRVEELLHLVEMAGLGARYPAQLSGGQQQRVALARALAHQPEVLLLDEPFGALDVKIRTQLRNRLKEIQRKLKLTTILVTHDQEEAFELADRVGVLERGHLVEIGSPEDLYYRPRTKFVANFIGGKNVVRGRIRSGCAQIGQVSLPLPKGSAAFEEGTRIWVLLRPEILVLDPDPFPADTPLRVLGKGRVMERVFLGSSQRILLDLEETTEGLRSTPISEKTGLSIDAVTLSQGTPDPRFAPGQELWIAAQAYHVLDPEGPSMLIFCPDSPEGEATGRMGCYLAQAVGGRATLFDLVEDSEKQSGRQAERQALYHDWQKSLPFLDIRVRQGSGEAEIYLEAQKRLYDLIVLPWRRNKLEFQAELGPIPRHFLENLKTPVLLVETPHLKLERILICTAAGEPGKRDVQFAGRLARRAEVPVTLLHVIAPQVAAVQRQLAERHLVEAKGWLQSLGIDAEAKTLEEDSPVAAVLREAGSGKYDLIVIGAPAPRSPHLLRWHDSASRIVQGAARPVLLVPMTE